KTTAAVQRSFAVNRTLLLFASLAIVACSKTQEFPADRAIETPTAIAAAAPISSPTTPTPSAPRLVQLRTLHPSASFDGDFIATKDGLFDPETLAPVLPPPRDTKIEHPLVRAVTPSRFSQIVGNRGLIGKEGEGAVVKNMATGRDVLKVESCA